MRENKINQIEMLNRCFVCHEFLPDTQHYVYGQGRVCMWCKDKYNIFEIEKFYRKWLQQ